MTASSFLTFQTLSIIALGLTAFLLGPDAGALTGQTLTVCGGASL